METQVVASQALEIAEKKSSSSSQINAVIETDAIENTLTEKADGCGENESKNDGEDKILEQSISQGKCYHFQYAGLERTDHRMLFID